MPESPELRIMSDFINHNSKNKIFKSAYHVEKGNIPHSFLHVDFNVTSTSNGKELKLNLNNIPIYFFMGMSGNWKYVPTSEWNLTKFVRFKMDDNTGNSLLLYGGFMGPKYSVGYPFKGTKRGPDPINEFDNFQKNILSNIDNKIFNNPICEVLLNQKYFNGVGNYIRSTILYYADINPFDSARNIIESNSNFLKLCKEIPIQSYKYNGGQLKDWTNPFNVDSENFKKWVYYKKGLSCKDKTGRTFWFNPKWKEYCPYPIKNDINYD